MRRAILAAAALGLLIAARAPAAANYVTGVPDWNQPTLNDANLADGGPINVVNNPAVNSPVNAWCVPTASADIMGYYRDTLGGLSIADNQAFPSGPANPAVDWRDDSVDAVTAAPAFRQDLGWYLNTNDIGDQTMPVTGAMTGTNYANILPGLGGYFTAHALAPQIVNFALVPGPLVGLDNSGVGGNHTVPMAYQRIRTEVDADRPLLLHVHYWNLAQRISVLNDPNAPVPDYDHALWGGPVQSGPGGEEYQTGDIGHTVTLVGYWDGGAGAVAGHPFSGLGNGGSTPDAVIVHDNGDGTLAGLTRALPLVVPFSTGEGNAGLNVPWVMQTEISNVPEPGTLAILALGGAALGQRRRRRR